MKKISLIILLALSLMMTACTSGGKDAKPDKKTESSDDTSKKSKADKIKKAKKALEKAAESEGTINEDEEDPRGYEDESDKKSKKKKKLKKVEEEYDLTRNELDIIEDNFNTVKYNGFLHCQFDDPTELDLNEVFYNGAGIDKEGDRGKIQRAYLKEVGEEEILGDLTVLGRDDIDDFLMSTTGYDYVQMMYPLDYVYLDKYDVFVLEHGDTNFSNFKAVSGTVQGDLYTVQYSTVDWDGAVNDDLSEVIFTADGDDYCFKSNTYLEGRIDYRKFYMLPESDVYEIYEEELEDLNDWQLRIARNEIYARHGRKFKDQDVQNYFDNQNWYNGYIEPDDWDDSVLSEIEKINIKTIQREEEHRK